MHNCSYLKHVDDQTILTQTLDNMKPEKNRFKLLYLICKLVIKNGKREKCHFRGLFDILDNIVEPLFLP